jgi:uncharacterized integral membrane protein (TIGR00698 family)
MLWHHREVPRTTAAWPTQERRKPVTTVAALPGWAFMAAVAAVSVLFVELLAPHVTIGGLNPFEAATVAILLGIALRAAGWVPAACGPGLRNYEAPLKLGIVLLGLGLTLGDAVRLGVQAMSAIVLCLVVAPVFIYLVTRRVGMTRNLGILLGVGTTICGTAAIAAAAPVIGAKDEEVSYAVSTVSLFGAVAMVVLPVIGAALAMDDAAFGVWAGLAVPSTPQVVGSGYMFSEAAGAQATVVKLTRNIFIIPAVLVLGLAAGRTAAPTRSSRPSRAAYVGALPGFVFGFLALTIVRSVVDVFAPVPAAWWETTLGGAVTVAKALVLIAMAGIGLNTRFQAMRTLGGAPLLVGVLAATFLAVVSYGIVRALAIGQ